MTVQVVFETHSTSTDNEAGIATGWNDGELSEVGREQARALGARRRDDRVDEVICSDLRRAVETAELAFGDTSIPVVHDPRLRECDYGAFNGMPRSMLDAERRRRLDEPWPGGESWRQAVERVAGLVRELPRTHDGKRVVVIGHVATRWAFDHVVDGIPLESLVAEEFAWREGWEYRLGLAIRSLAADEVERVDAVLPLNRLDTFATGATTYLVAWDGDWPVGHAHVAWAGTHLGSPEIQDVYVLPEQRRAGVATALTRAAEAAARASGHTEVGLSVGTGNPAAAALYGRLGFVDAGVAPVPVRGTIMLRGEPYDVDDTLMYLRKRLS
jgi:2,3-bisphosphoglycerate-dependent phosphoglycerate mutase